MDIKYGKQPNSARAVGAIAFVFTSATFVRLAQHGHSLPLKLLLGALAMAATFAAYHALSKHYDNPFINTAIGTIVAYQLPVCNDATRYYNAKHELLGLLKKLTPYGPISNDLMSIDWVARRGYVVVLHVDDGRINSDYLIDRYYVPFDHNKPIMAETYYFNNEWHEQTDSPAVSLEVVENLCYRVNPSYQMGT